MKSFLERIKSPDEISDLTFDELEVLALEVRNRIIEVMSVNGGHLASNLGNVELSLALHKVFNSPKDKMVFDVSHQVYTHKLLTGRNDRFDTIRQFEGLSGFSSPDESEHDHFFAGHAGTALSLALGLAKARDLSNKNDYILPIIGDAALTCGLTLEALNNITPDLKNFIVILNDNAMSISKNVGAITGILSRFFNHPTANKVYSETEKLLSKAPGCGKFLAKQGHKLTESLKSLISTAPFFEQYGLSYVGPIDGHNIKQLVSTLEQCKNLNKPVLLHALTVKGQGMSTAIKNPTTYHGVKPFDLETGKLLPIPTAKPTFPKIFGKYLLELASQDESIVAITPAMPAGSCITSFMEKYPERCIDVGIAEGHSVTFAGGIAKDLSKKVVVSIYSTFLQRALDNLYHDVCLQKLPVIFAIDRGGIAGGDGVTHNGIYDIGFLKSMPNMIIAQPRNGHLLKELLSSSFKWNLPVAIRYPNLATEESDTEVSERKIGVGEVVSKGKDIAIIALGHKVYTALEAKKHLSKEGLDITVVDPIFVKPLDIKLLYKIFMTHEYIVTLEEHSLQSGIGESINSFILANQFGHLKVLNLGIKDVFIEQGSHKLLTESISLDAKSVAKAILEEFSTLSELTLTKAEV